MGRQPKSARSDPEPLSWKIDKERLILCEGEQDQLFLEALIKHRGLPAFQVRTVKESNAKATAGNTGFGPSIRGLPPMPGFDKLIGIAIITDYDNNKSLSDLITRLKKYGYKPTKSDPRIGTLANTCKPPVILILIPNDEECGVLEDLCLPALYDKWPGSSEKVREYLKSTGALDWQKQNKLPKAKVRAIIAGHYEDDPYKNFHNLFRDGILRGDHECFEDLANILARFDDIAKYGRF